MRLQKDILGKEILNNEGNIVGRVKDVCIDPSNMKLTSLIVSGVSKKSGFSFTGNNNDVEEKIPIEEVGSIGDKILLTESLSDILNNL